MTIRWGIIGCGKVTEIKSGPGFQQAAGSELVMVIRRDAVKAEDYAGRHGVSKWTTDAFNEDQIEIAGTQGTLTMSVFGNEPVRLETAAGIELLDLPNPPHIQQPLIQSIVDQLRGRGQCPSTGVTALRTARVMDQVLTDYYDGRDDAFWTRPETWPGRGGRAESPSGT
jgi:hypothetical protein